jgi:hypothetical protein
MATLEGQAVLNSFLVGGTCDECKHHETQMCPKRLQFTGHPCRRRGLAGCWVEGRKDPLVEIEYRSKFPSKEAEIEYTLGAITPGEWRLVCSDPQDDPVIETDGEREVLGVSEWLRCEKPDIQFLGNAKGYVEYLLAENKKLREQLSPKVTEHD